MNYTEIQFMNSLIINAIIYLLAAVIVVTLDKNSSKVTRKTYKEF